MNWDEVKGQWRELKGSVREKWGKLTDDDFESIAGKKERLIGKLQSYYGHQKEAAEKEIDGFMSELNKGLSKANK